MSFDVNSLIEMAKTYIVGMVKFVQNIAETLLPNNPELAYFAMAIGLAWILREKFNSLSTLLAFIAIIYLALTFVK